MILDAEPFPDLIYGIAECVEMREIESTRSGALIPTATLDDGCSKYIATTQAPREVLQILLLCQASTYA